jgi:hypothetical protein
MQDIQVMHGSGTDPHERRITRNMLKRSSYGASPVYAVGDVVEVLYRKDTEAGEDW